MSLSILDVSYIPLSETSVESGGVICRTPIFADRTAPIELPVELAICSARVLASLAADLGVVILRRVGLDQNALIDQLCSLTSDLCDLVDVIRAYLDRLSQ